MARREKRERVGGKERCIYISFVGWEVEREGERRKEKDGERTGKVMSRERERGGG